MVKINKTNNEAEAMETQLIHKHKDLPIYTYKIKSNISNDTIVTIEKEGSKWIGFESKVCILDDGYKIYLPMHRGVDESTTRKTKKEILEFYIFLLNE